MNLNQNQLLVRYYFWLLSWSSQSVADHRRLTGTNLCAFVRTILVRTLVGCAVLTVPLYVLYRESLGVAGVFLSVGVFLALIFALLYGIGLVFENVLIAYIKAKKAKICPLVTFK